MKTTSVIASAVLLAWTPALLRAQDQKPADPPKAEEPKPEEKKEEPKKEEPKKEEPRKEEPKKEEPRPEAPKNDAPKPKSDEEQKPGQPAAEAKPKNDEGPPAQEKFSRETAEILNSWEPALDSVRRATVKITREGKDIAYGCAVHENGYIVTKAGEVHDKKGAFLTNLEIVFPEGLRLPAKLADLHRPYDLALLKVEARGLRPMPWDDSVQPAPGSFLAAATPMKLPAAVGVLSVLPRNFDDSQKGWMGVGLEDAGESVVKIVNVASGSPASQAGLVIDDVIKTIDGKNIGTVEEFIKTISSCRPYQKVKLVVMREKGDREMEVTLASRGQNLRPPGEDPRNRMAGQLSNTRGGFPDAFQHDMVLQPNEIGGPVVDLDGRVVGMNIARSGRIECVAVPAKAMKALLTKVSEGKFYHPELDALRDERKNAEAALDRLKKDLEKLNSRIKEAEDPTAEPEEKKEEK
jgi:serine protease Do